MFLPELTPVAKALCLFQEGFLKEDSFVIVLRSIPIFRREVYIDECWQMGIDL